MRRCPRCGRTLPESDFYRMGNRLQGWCRECSRSYNREWRRDNPGKRYLPCPAGWQEDRMLACPCKRIVCCICSLLSIVFAILIVCYDGSSTRRKGCAMGAYFHVIDRRDSESIERFRRELGRLRETEHLHSDRRERVRRIARDIGFGHPVRRGQELQGRMLSPWELRYQTKLGLCFGAAPFSWRDGRQGGRRKG